MLSVHKTERFFVPIVIQNNSIYIKVLWFVLVIRITISLIAIWGFGLEVSEQIFGLELEVVDRFHGAIPMIPKLIV